MQLKGYFLAIYRISLETSKHNKYALMFRRNILIGSRKYITAVDINSVLDNYTTCIKFICYIHIISIVSFIAANSIFLESYISFDVFEPLNPFVWAKGQCSITKVITFELSVSIMWHLSVFQWILFNLDEMFMVNWFQTNWTKNQCLRQV